MLEALEHYKVRMIASRVTDPHFNRHVICIKEDEGPPLSLQFANARVALLRDGRVLCLCACFHQLRVAGLRRPQAAMPSAE